MNLKNLVTNAFICTIQEGIGNVSEGDVKTALASKHDPILIAFNVAVDTAARDLLMQNEKEVHSFEIIYKLSEWLAEEIKKRTPKMEVAEDLGSAKILMKFSSVKNKYVIGGKVKNGELKIKCLVRIRRANEIIGEGKILNLQSGKQSAATISEGSEFGAQIESSVPIEVHDVVECYKLVIK